MNGATLVPFAMMMGGVYSRMVMDELVATNKVMLAIAGFIGTIFVIGELIRTEPA